MRELRHNTDQIVRVGVLLEYTKDNPHKPISGAQLNWFWWRYLIRADGCVQDIVNHTWDDIPNCDGLYFLTLTVADTNQLGPLSLYIMDETGLGAPIFMEFNVIDQIEYDSRYTSQLSRVISEHAQKG